MQITTGCGKGGFTPTARSGDSNVIRAGNFSPFTMTLTRQDGEDNPKTLAVTSPRASWPSSAASLVLRRQMPPPATARQAARSEPSPPPPASAEPRCGSPSPARAPPPSTWPAPTKAPPTRSSPWSQPRPAPSTWGPVVNRAAIYVDPDHRPGDDHHRSPAPDPRRRPRPLPHDPRRRQPAGIHPQPDQLRAKQIKATVTASNGAVAEPSASFQATNCAKFAYSPKLKLSFKGATKRSGNPAVKAVLTQPANQANTAGATVILPS